MGEVVSLDTSIADAGRDAGSGACSASAPSRLRRHGRSILFWVRRYLPAELVGTASLYLASWLAASLGGGPVVVAYAATIGESAGFYLVLGTAIFREQRRMPPRKTVSAVLRRTGMLLIAECGPAEILDVLVTRPLLIVVSMYLAGDVWGLLVGKIAADVVFYLTAGLCYTLTVRLGLRGERRGDGR